MFLTDKQIGRVLERNREYMEKRRGGSGPVLNSGSQGYRVKGTGDGSVTLSSTTGGLGKGTGLYAIESDAQSCPPSKPVLGNANQSKRVYSPEGSSVALCSGDGGYGNKTGLYAIKAVDNRGSQDTGQVSAVTTGSIQNRVYSDGGISPTLSATDYKRPKKVAVKAEENATETGGTLPLTRSDSQAYRVYSTEGTSVTLRANAGGLGAKSGLYATKLHWYPQEHLDDIVAGTKKLIADNDPGGEGPRAVSEVKFSKSKKEGARVKPPEKEMFTLRTETPHGVAVSPADGGKGVMVLDGVAYNVRRLTPRECFRLQGFPDELFDKAAAVCSDTQLYKQAGNAVTATVSYEIGKWIMELEAKE